jgi:hypothetical protein
MKATDSILAIDNDTSAAKQTADAIIHLLSDFIPHHCRKDAWDRLAEACYREGMELTSKHMRKEYEAIKNLTLDATFGRKP